MAEPMEDVAVERTERFAVSPDALWDAITDPELLEEWFGPVDFDLTPGGAITEPDATGATRTIGVVESVEPRRRIGFVWLPPGSEAPSAVELVVDADGANDDGAHDDGDQHTDGSVLHVREVRIRLQPETRPDWFTSPPRARARA
jgi:uncharacterized protein YndB with AHSA1/START domain